VRKLQDVNRRELLKRISVSSIEGLRTKLVEGISSLDKGHGIEGEEAFRRIRERV